jgi:hypothetical protein
MCSRASTTSSSRPRLGPAGSTTTGLHSAIDYRTPIEHEDADYLLQLIPVVVLVVGALAGSEGRIGTCARG